MVFDYKHKTPSADINIRLSLKSICADELVQYENKYRFSKLCERQCVNYDRKWSCPPHSPAYTDYSKNFRYCLLILLSCRLSDFDHVKSGYMKVKTSNSILKSQSDRLTRFLESELAGRMLSNGSCRLCKPCSKKTSGDKCKKPEKLRYSMESLGLNVAGISQDYFNHPLLWYKNKTIPQYSTVVSAVLTNKPLQNGDIESLIMKYFPAFKINPVNNH